MQIVEAKVISPIDLKGRLYLVGAKVKIREDHFKQLAKQGILEKYVNYDDELQQLPEERKQEKAKIETKEEKAAYQTKQAKAEPETAKRRGRKPKSTSKSS